MTDVLSAEIALFLGLFGLRRLYVAYHRGALRSEWVAYCWRSQAGETLLSPAVAPIGYGSGEDPVLVLEGRHRGLALEIALDLEGIFLRTKGTIRLWPSAALLAEGLRIAERRLVPLPGEPEVEGALSARYEVRARYAGQARALLAAPGLKATITRFLRQNPGARVEGGAVVVERSPLSPEDMPALLAEMRGVVQALRDAETAAWQQPLERWGLTSRQRYMGLWELAGEVEGVPLTLKLTPGELRVQAPLDVAMPRAFYAIHADHSDQPGRRVGNPVLDGLIYLRGSEGTAELLRDPEVSGALLAVVHAFPGSTVNSGEVVLRHHGYAAGQIDEPIRAVVALVQAIRRYGGG